MFNCLLFMMRKNLRQPIISNQLRYNRKPYINLSNNSGIMIQNNLIWYV